MFIISVLEIYISRDPPGQCVYIRSKVHLMFKKYVGETSLLLETRNETHGSSKTRLVNEGIKMENKGEKQGVKWIGFLKTGEHATFLHGIKLRNSVFNFIVSAIVNFSKY